ncbi:hypothetical protein BT96DRAFT_998568 [Gymnopus androsaceus JB14]|uniref:Uncharacterized protein n=1 Tax=Gymnopus androsaceus JB14 TaxID=1447944 RepID=A0A6A4HB72_9AGAR|nr:hypothetical protein BT96DRAFT_998568 [Gymnopus androsaceus JB14]
MTVRPIQYQPASQTDPNQTPTADIEDVAAPTSSRNGGWVRAKTQQRRARFTLPESKEEDEAVIYAAFPVKRRNTNWDRSVGSLNPAYGSVQGIEPLVPTHQLSETDLWKSLWIVLSEEEPVRARFLPHWNPKRLTKSSPCLYDFFIIERPLFALLLQTATSSTVVAPDQPPLPQSPEPQISEEGIRNRWCLRLALFSLHPGFTHLVHYQVLYFDICYPSKPQEPTSAVTIARIVALHRRLPHQQVEGMIANLLQVEFDCRSNPVEIYRNLPASSLFNVGLISSKSGDLASTVSETSPASGYSKPNLPTESSSTIEIRQWICHLIASRSRTIMDLAECCHVESKFNNSPTLNASRHPPPFVFHVALASPSSCPSSSPLSPYFKWRQRRHPRTRQYEHFKYPHKNTPGTQLHHDWPTRLLDMLEMQPAFTAMIDRIPSSAASAAANSNCFHLPLPLPLPFAASPTPANP